MTFIVVDYNTSDFIKKLYKSIKKNINKINYKIIVITSLESKCWKNLYEFSQSKEIDLIVQKKNMGFGMANNIGLLNSKSKYVCFINPDIEFIENMDDFFLKGIKDLKKDKNIGIISPNLLNLDRTQQNFWGFFPKGKKKISYYKSELSKISYVEFPWIIGAFYLLKKEDIPDSTPFDKNIFMYCEDLDLCIRYKKINKKILVNKKFDVIHYGGSSLYDLQENEKFKRKYYLDRKALFYIMKKHYSLIFTYYYFIIRMVGNFIFGKVYKDARRNEIWKIYKKILLEK